MKKSMNNISPFDDEGLKPHIKRHMELGCKYLGSGDDAIVFEHYKKPTSVFRIGKNGRAYDEWYVLANFELKGNPHVPVFYKHHRDTDTNIVLSEIEKLEHISEYKVRTWKEINNFCELAYCIANERPFLKEFKISDDWMQIAEVIGKKCTKENKMLDLNISNFMLRWNGQIVLTDPWDYWVP